MGGVDRVDQQLHNISPLRKSYKWYKKLAFRIIMQIVLNAQKIYVLETGISITLLEFLRKVITSWVTVNEGLPVNRPQDETIIRLNGRHFPNLLIAQPDALDQRPVKRCRVCYAKRNPF